MAARISQVDYLTQKYMTAEQPSDARPKKKRKRDGLASATSGLVIQDDDLSGWTTFKDAEDEDAPIVVGDVQASRKMKTSGWASVDKHKKKNATASSDQAAADAILRSAAEEQSAHAAADEDVEDAPTTLDDSADQRMESGALAGLQTAAQNAAAMSAHKKAKKAKQTTGKKGDDDGDGKGEATIFRDASGRRIDARLKRQELAAAQAAEEKAEREKQEALQAPAQRAEKERRREELQDAKFKPFARGVDDEDMNREMKEADRWNDPAAGFITKKKAGRSVSGKPLYKGKSMPNRYGIRPGYRWDGVDRGTGFESKWFAARNKQRERKQMEVAWEMDE